MRNYVLSKLVDEICSHKMRNPTKNIATSFFDPVRNYWDKRPPTPSSYQA